ncbi:MAG: hypothetical protein GX213_14540 [Clostridiaceae bacterium]|nr:hypothetical protein [Clostridiaceae bacterium]
MRKKEVSALKVAATYIGTVVGAGFATGQEVLQFFARFGISGLGGLFITTVLFIIFGYIILSLGSILHARSHLEIIQYSGGKYLGTIIDAVITIFLFGTFAVMIAGNGALFEQQLKLPPMVGNVIMAVLTALTVLTGINGVINSISFVVPFLLSTVMLTSLLSIVQNPVNLTAAPIIIHPKGFFNNWFLATVLYVSYNTVISIAILGPLGNETQNKRAVRNGAILGGLGLGFGAAMIFFALSGYMTNIGNLEVPMLYIAGSISPMLQVIYAVVLIAEIYTTAVSSLYGFTSRIIDMQKKPVKGRYIVTGSTVVALLSSRLGFSNLVMYLYPLIGYCGMFILTALVIRTLKDIKSR